MKSALKFAIVPALALAVGFYAERSIRLKDVVNLTHFDEAAAILNKVFVAALPKVDVGPVDPASAARIDEELDYRIAQRSNSLEGWRSFLAAHSGGAYAKAARTEFEKLSGATNASSSMTATAASFDAKTESEDKGSAPSFPQPDVAPSSPDEICSRDEVRLEQLRRNPNGGEAARFAIELGCERLRPELLTLMASLTSGLPPRSAQRHNLPSPEQVRVAPAPRERATEHVARKWPGLHASWRGRRCHLRFDCWRNSAELFWRGREELSPANRR